jgi:hypothetical protein
MSLVSIILMNANVFLVKGSNKVHVKIQFSKNCLDSRVIRLVLKREYLNTLFPQNWEQSGWSVKNMVDQK